MIYDSSREQFFSTDGTIMKYGMDLRLDILGLGVNVIRAGTVMVFASPRRNKLIMFQTLKDMLADELSSVSLIAYEPGSIMGIDVDTRYRPTYIPTFRFRDCRMPTYSEFDKYNRCDTV